MSQSDFMLSMMREMFAIVGNLSERINLLEEDSLGGVSSVTLEQRMDFRHDLHALMAGFERRLSDEW